MKTPEQILRQIEDACASFKRRRRVLRKTQPVDAREIERLDGAEEQYWLLHEWITRKE